MSGEVAGRVIVRQYLKTLGRRWVRHGNHTAAAAIAFFAMFTFAPLVFFTLSACSYLVGSESAQEAARAWISQFMGTDRAEILLLSFIEGSFSTHGYVAGAFSAIVLLYASSTSIFQVRLALNRIFGAGHLAFHEQLLTNVIGRLLAAGYALFFGAVLGLVVIANVIAQVVQRSALGDTHWDDGFRAIASPIASWLIVAGVFFVVMKYLPSKSPQTSRVVLGASIAAGLFELGKYFIVYYLSHSVVTAAYGASSALVFVLLWTFYSVQIFLLGAEVAAVDPHEHH
jgi:membrane protein